MRNALVALTGMFMFGPFLRFAGIIQSKPQFIKPLLVFDITITSALALVVCMVIAENKKP